MRHGTIGGPALAALLVGLGMASPAAGIDLSGDYVVFNPVACTLTLVQAGTSLQVTGFCSGLPLSLSGTVDPDTGAFTVTGAIPGLCTDLVCSGTGDGEESSITCMSNTDPLCNGPLTATKCGNGVIDPMENCEDGNHTNGDCCSTRCRADPEGTACTIDDNLCTDDVCNATGTCMHVPHTRPCNDGDACTIGDVCAGGSCVSGTRALAGQACERDDDSNPCTVDLCDAAGACTTHVPMSPAECRRTLRRRDVDRCMATECEDVGRKACRRRCKPAAIGTLAYVLSECREDAGRSFVGRQELRIRRGDRRPITVAKLGPSTPVPDPLGLCRAYGETGVGGQSVGMFPFQRLGVSPDGSAVVFEVNDQAPVFRSISVSPDENGFFLVRADGSQPPRRLGPPSGDPSFRVPNPFRPGESGDLGGFYTLSPLIAFSPNGRRIAFTDVGPGPDGHDAVQIVVLDLGADPPQRTQVTKLRSGTPPDTYEGGAPLLFTCCPRFIDDQTVGFETYADPDGSNPDRLFAAFTVGIDGRGLKPVARPAVPANSHLVPSFGVVGAGANLVRVAEASEAFPVTEIFLQADKRLLQLTQFGRPDTFAGFVDARRSRAFFLGSADPLTMNPNGTCQIFSVDTFGGELRQVTRLDRGYPHDRGCFVGGGGIGYGYYRIVDQDAVTSAIIFNTALDPFHLGAGPTRPDAYGYDDDQIFAVRQDGTGLRQLTDAAGSSRNTDGSIRVVLPGPFAYPILPR